MKKYEVLSPAGDLESFKVAIKSGADAVYLGLSKFNARMKADNISLENIAEVIDYAHLRDVRVYITINTLISSSEMDELIEMVGVCLKAGADAFIVQDYGVIHMLKSVYPNIVLHGSTQLGVHNVRGARVAKAMGLSRVVLSREVTLEDIREIKQNVDIELEVFVQGAMCVCFSGNCYMSSLKFNASGNRGLCKQLCRLSYNMSTSNKKKSGYLLSPRDNCMLRYLQDLCDIGVESFKIEGRLRRPGYVGVATRVYREVIDSILCKRQIDFKTAEKDLKKVFSRGEFIPGYFDGNNIIDPLHNNHMGDKIGRVLKCEKFKDIFKITIVSGEDLHSGDGLKFVDGDNVVTLGVGNVDIINNNIVVYGKNHVNAGFDVYRVLDSEFERNIIDYSKKRVVDMDISLVAENPAQLIVKCDGFEVKKIGSKVQTAKSKPLEKNDVATQLDKLNNDALVIGKINVELGDNVFVPKSELNAIRREAVSELVEQILNSYKQTIVQHEKPMSNDLMRDLTFGSIAIVDEKQDISRLNSDYESLVLSPTIYSKGVVEKFLYKFKKYFNAPLVINLPIIAMSQDLKIIDDIVSFAMQNNIILLANNIYALDYINEGAIVFAGFNMNVVSKYSISALKNLGVKEVVSSIENWFGGIANTYKMGSGNRVLMTFAHCPNKTLCGNGCDATKTGCVYSDKLKLVSQSGEYPIRRYMISNCYFELIDDYNYSKTASNSIDDLRGRE